MDVIGKYEIKPFTRYRQYVADIEEGVAKKKHGVSLCEIDITKARQYFRDYKRKTGEGLSNTGWIIKCIGQAVSEHKQVQAYRHRDGKLVIFDDVDIWLAVEITFDGEQEVRPYIIRKVNEKSFREIHDEIRKAPAELLEKERARRAPGAKTRRDILHWPWPKFVGKFFWILKKLFWQKLRKDAFFAKKIMGTVEVTTPSMSTKSAQWNVGGGLHSLLIGVGRIAKKPGVIDDKIEIREYIGLSIAFDHIVIDGVPLNRFIERLTGLMESAYGLVD